MKRMKKIAMFASVLAAVILLFSCGSGGDPDPKQDPDTPTDSEPDFTSHNTDYSILVRNNTNERLVAFQGDLVASKLIGGIPAHATNHGLPKDPVLFDVTKDFPMIILTESQYNANKDNLISQKNTPFTRVYVFYNRSGDNTSVYEIAEGLGGNNSFIITNTSVSINVELRVNGPAGETLGFAPAGILNTTLKLQDGDYSIFPVFKRYNRTRDVIETVYPRGSGTGYAWFREYSFSNGNTEEMNLKDLLRNTTFTSGAAWLVINNQTTSGGIRFFEGSTPRVTPSGNFIINNADLITFQIDMPKVGENSYADSIDVSNWTFGPSGFAHGLQVSATDTTPIPTQTILRDKMYTVTVIGTLDNDSIQAYISATTDIPQSEIGGTW